jgi:hypothetical protein
MYKNAEQNPEEDPTDPLLTGLKVKPSTYDVSTQK